MAENNITIEDIDMLVLHQASLFVLRTIQDKLNIPDNKMLIDLEDVGNTSSSSIPIALKRAEANGKIKQNDKVLLFGFGIGLSWSGTYINY
jgi:3-oxoacyl-[acyl-carrier-protein] synthase III